MIEVVLGDITTLDVDAIVNAANSALCGGGGVDGAIHAAAGPRLLAACREIGRCATGDAKLTPGFELKARYVIHAVGPVWDGGEHGEDALLESCYRRSLEIAEGEQLASIAFPAISCGAYRFPSRRASQIAVAAIRKYLSDHSCTIIKRVLLVAFDSQAEGELRKALRQGGPCG